MFNTTPIALDHTAGGDAGICGLWIRERVEGDLSLHPDQFANGGPSLLNTLDPSYVNLAAMDELADYFPSATFTQKSKKTDSGTMWAIEVRLTKSGDSPTEDLPEVLRMLQDREWILVIKLASGRYYYIGSADRGADAMIDYSAGTIRGSAGNETDFKFEWESPFPCIELIP